MLSIYKLEQAEQWDKVVRSFIDYDVYWLSGYVKGFQIHGDGEPVLFFYDDGSTRGINVVMKRDIAKDIRFHERITEGCLFDFTTPYGYGGWLIEGDGVECLFSAYNNWAERNGIVSEFVRFHPMIGNHDACSSFYKLLRLGEVVHMSLSSRQMIWNNLISKNRNMIRKALKNDIQIYNGRFPEIYDAFRKIYNETMDKNDVDEYYYFEPAFYKSILDDLPQNAQVFWAEREGQIIAASIFLTANGRMNYHLSGTHQEYYSLAPTNLLLYKAALWGCENGYKTMLLGGGVGSGNDSLFKFKKAFFTGELNHFYIGQKIFNLEKYNELLSMKSPVESSFFPLYRAEN